ncbi:MAG: sodium:proton antiporter [Ignavibacteria bacterium]|nr:sodium:proton antiporter [Ignavibacteria bacterium]
MAFGIANHFTLCEITALPSWWAVIPFLTLLLCIALGPVLFHKIWEKRYPVISIVLAIPVTIYYSVILQNFNGIYHSLLEYTSFIVFLGSLFVATGGIHIGVQTKATPVFNVFFLLFGAIIANIIGTTGASMLLIRPFLRINKGRVKPYHVVFFIFIVSNVGGALTPVGDPPLFIGYLRGVPFFWIIGHVWYIWLFALVLLLAIFYVYDRGNRHTPEEEFIGKFRITFKGRRNLLFLLLILGAVFLDPKILPWIPDIHPFPLGIRELVMLGVIFASYILANKEAHHHNEFHFGPIKEVAILFFGIFITMVPALQLISVWAARYGAHLTQSSFYWGSGVLSSFLDNAPTYLSFLSAAMGKYGMDVNSGIEVLQFINSTPHYVTAISVASVFFGAMTYIGNGPNFMVKSISEHSGIKMPSFFSYIAIFALPVLLPVFVLVWLLFFL